MEYLYSRVVLNIPILKFLQFRRFFHQFLLLVYLRNIVSTISNICHNVYLYVHAIMKEQLPTNLSMINHGSF